MMPGKTVLVILLLCLWSATSIGQSLTVTDIYDACDSQLGEATLTLSGVSASTYPISARYTNTSTGYTELFTMTSAVHTLHDLDTGEYELEFYLTTTSTFMSCLEIGEVEMVFDISHDSPVCISGNIEVDVDGGYPPYDYAWSSGQTTASIYNVMPGEYTLTVTDSRGCDYEAIVNMEGSVDASVTVQDACGNIGQDGRITVDYTTDLSFCQWSHDPLYQGFVANNLSHGTYEVTYYGRLLL